MLGNMMGIDWELIGNNKTPTPHLLKKTLKNLNPFGACCLTSLAIRIVFAYNFLPFLAMANGRGMAYGSTCVHLPL
jgi:hypothetical protein